MKAAPLSEIIGDNLLAIVTFVGCVIVVVPFLIAGIVKGMFRK